jgi:hypothetical protein
VLIVTARVNRGKFVLGAARMNSPLRPVALALLTLVAACDACGRPPVDAVDAGNPDGGAPDWSRLLQDKATLSTHWYIYASENHTLTSRDQSYMLKDLRTQPVRYAGFRIVSSYDPTTAESGRFTLAVNSFDGAAWTAEQTWLLSRFVGANPLCLDVFTQQEVDCVTGDWNLQLRVFGHMVAEGPLVVNDPGFLVPSLAGDSTHQKVLMATVFGTQDLTTLPNPTGISDLADGPATGWETIDYDLTHFSPQVPEVGMVLGARATGPGFTPLDNVYIMLNVRRKFIKFTVSPVSAGDVSLGFEFRYAISEFNLETRFPVGFGALKTLTVVPPATVGDVVWLSLDQDNPVVTPTIPVTPFLPLTERSWDLALHRTPDGRILIASSPSCALGNAAVLLNQPGVTLENALQ